MMTENEIRIGNCFHHSPQWSYRNEVPENLPNGFNFKWSSTDFYALGECTLSLESIDPIPLDADILGKCGFKKCTCGGWKNSIHLDFNMNHREAVEMLYLHQLQNLYFALTGQELEIKL